MPTHAPVFWQATLQPYFWREQILGRWADQVLMSEEMYSLGHSVIAYVSGSLVKKEGSRLGANWGSKTRGYLQSMSTRDSTRELESNVQNREWGFQQPMVRPTIASFRTPRGSELPCTLNVKACEDLPERWKQQMFLISSLEISANAPVRRVCLLVLQGIKLARFGFRT